MRPNLLLWQKGPWKLPTTDLTSSRPPFRGWIRFAGQIQETSKRIKRLGESSQEIGDIVSLINDIADQTNILSLNAAIQASMAGDAGRGFRGGCRRGTAPGGAFQCCNQADCGVW